MVTSSPLGHVSYDMKHSMSRRWLGKQMQFVAVVIFLIIFSPSSYEYLIPHQSEDYQKLPK